MKKKNKKFKFKSFVSGILISIMLIIFSYFVFDFVLSDNKIIVNQRPQNTVFKPLDQLEHRDWNSPNGKIAIPIFNEEKIRKDGLTKKRSYKERKILGSIPIRMYSSSYDVENYAMNDLQFETFVNKLEEKLPYGPEIYGLNIIFINKYKGNYFNPLYRHINIETRSFYEKADSPVFETTKQPNEEYVSFYDRHIQVLVHEYLHYLDHVYARSYGDFNSKKLYDLGGDTIVINGRIPDPSQFRVNKKFIETFKKILNYDNKNLLTPLKSSAVKKDKNNLKFVARDLNDQKVSLVSVANKYPVKWMWDRVNESKKVNLKIPKGQENIVIGSKKYFNFWKYNKDYSSIWSKRQYYSYKYSELFARRFSSLLYKEDGAKTEKFWSLSPLGFYSRWKKGYIVVDNVRRFDASTSKTDFWFSKLTPNIFNPLDTFNRYNNSLKIQDIWFDDYPYDAQEITNPSFKEYYTSRSTKLYDSLRKLMGQYNTSNISWIFRNNRFKYRNWDNLKKEKEILSYINGILALVRKIKSQNPSLKIPDWVWNNLNSFNFEPSSKTDSLLLRMGGYLKKSDIENTLGLSLLNFNQKLGLEARLGILNRDNTITTLNKKVIIQKYNVKKVASFIENEYVDFNPLDGNYFWVINNLDNQNLIKNDQDNKFLEDFDYQNDFVNLKKVENKKLVLFNQNDPTKYFVLKTARSEKKNDFNEFGLTNTITKKTLFELDNNFAEAIEDEKNQFAKIIKRVTKFV